MKLDEIKEEIGRLSEEEQNQLAAYLVHLRHERDSEIRREITAKMNDNDPQNWISLDALRKNWKD